MKLIRLALAAALFATIAVPASAQTFKTDYSTQLILAGGAGVGGGTNTINTVTLNAASNGSAPITFTLPDTIPSLLEGTGYLLTVSPTGGFYWTNPTLGLTLGGDVIGQAGHNTVIGASGTAFHVVHDISVGGGQHVTGADTIGGLLTANLGLTSNGGPANISTTGNSGVNIGTSNNGNGPGLITIGDSIPTVSVSVTDINGEVNFGGAVDFNGPVNIPSGDLNLGLAQNNLYVGNTNGIAAPLAPSDNSVLITDGTGNVSWGATLPTAVQDNTTNMGTGGGATNTIGNGGESPSTTTINGTVSFPGTVSFTTAPTTPLATNDIFIGNATTGGQAEAVGMTGDATMAFTTGPDAATLTLATVNATTGPFGSASSVATFTVNGKGLVTASGSTPIQIAESQVTGLTGDLTSATTTAEHYFTNGTGISLTAGVIANTGVLSVTGSGPLSANPTSGNVGISLTTSDLSSGGSITIGTGTGVLVGSGGATANLNMSNSNSWSALQSFTTLNTTGNTGIDDGAAGSAGTITIGNPGNNGPAPDSSVTTVNGFVNFTGNVNLPNGTLSPASIPLADGDILVGNSASPNVAAPVALSQDVTISDAGVATVQGSHAATTFAVVNAETVGGSLGVTGQTTIGSAQLSASANVDVTAGGAIAIGNAHSYVPLTTTGTQTAPITSFTGENMGAGQILTFSNVGANNITLHSTAGTFSLNGGDVIMGPGGTATLLSTGTNWILLSSQ